MNTDNPRFLTMDRRTLLKLGGAVAGASLAPWAFAQSDPKIIEAAKKEGAVSLYSSASTGPTNAVAEAFRKKYGIPVSVYRAGSADVATRVQTEEGANRTQADALIIEEPALSLVLPYLANYDSPERAIIDAAFKGPQYTLIRLYLSQIGWNANAVKGDVAPKDWKDLLDPRWRGRLCPDQAREAGSRAERRSIHCALVFSAARHRGRHDPRPEPHKAETPCGL